MITPDLDGLILGIDWLRSQGHVRWDFDHGRIRFGDREWIKLRREVGQPCRTSVIRLGQTESPNRHWESIFDKQVYHVKFGERESCLTTGTNTDAREASAGCSLGEGFPKNENFPCFRRCVVTDGGEGHQQHEAQSVNPSIESGETNYFGEEGHQKHEAQSVNPSIESGETNYFGEEGHQKHEGQSVNSPVESCVWSFKGRRSSMKWMQQYGKIQQLSRIKPKIVHIDKLKKFEGVQPRMWSAAEVALSARREGDQEGVTGPYIPSFSANERSNLVVDAGALGEARIFEDWNPLTRRSPHLSF